MRLDVVEVHGDVGDVAGEPHAAAVGRDVDLLGDVGAVEQQRVGAGLALDGVAAVAGVPDEGVVAGAQQGRVVAAAAVDEVVALAADDDVVAVAAVEREVDLAGVRAPEALMTSLPASAVDDQRSLPASAPAIVTCAARPLTTTDAPLPATLMLSSPAVPLTVTVSAAPSPAAARRRRQVDGRPASGRCR